MTWNGRGWKRIQEVQGECAAVRGEFSAYLDGAVSGVEMAAISAHMEGCKSCAKDFAVLREVQRSLVELGSAPPPMGLQARLRAALMAERERGTHLPLRLRMMSVWRSSLAPLALRLSGGLAAALMLAGGLSWMFGPPVVVQANDDAMAHMVAPRYLYSDVPPEPITTHGDVPIVVEAMVDSNGRVYDYKILEGPVDPSIRAMVENNLQESVFQPASVFGAPVRGHLVVIYSGVSVGG